MKLTNIMPSKDQGLTVGELTMAIGILIIGILIWSNLNNDKSEDQSLLINHKEISSYQSS